MTCFNWCFKTPVEKAKIKSDLPFSRPTSPIPPLSRPTSPVPLHIIISPPTHRSSIVLIDGTTQYSEYDARTPSNLYRSFDVPSTPDSSSKEEQNPSPS